MKKISKKVLEGTVLPSITSKPVPVTYEAFGRKVCAFLSTPEGMTRTEFEDKLEEKGCQVDRRYWPGTNRVEITNISYFKAWHWNE